MPPGIAGIVAGYLVPDSKHTHLFEAILFPVVCPTCLFLPGTTQIVNQWAGIVQGAIYQKPVLMHSKATFGQVR